MPPTLLIDNSNSRTKLALATRDALLEEKATLPTPGLEADALEEATKDWSFDRVVVSSVVPEKHELIRNCFGPGRTLSVTHELKLGVAIDFPEPATIGADRLANAAAVSALYHVPAVVIDFGTAVTFDIISGKNSYVGGVIAPGLDVMTDYLHQRTALLPRIDLEEPPGVIGKSTVDAMLAGVVHGYRGLIKEIVREISEEIGGEAASGSSVTLVATGGYADLIAARIPAIREVHENLTLEGLRLISNLNPE